MNSESYGRAALPEMRNYTLHFDLQPLNQLDEFGLLACQPYNLGNTNDWFGAFRGGIYAVSHRIAGVRMHFSEVHAWIPRPRLAADAEYHLASIFFNMDSALECLVFGLNGLGYAVDPSSFRDVSDPKSLRAVTPADVLGIGRQPLIGFTKFFRRFQTVWRRHQVLIEEIRDQHDVSKHREVIFSGGKSRTDVPPGFFEQFNVQNDKSNQFYFTPMAEIILRNDPKVPTSKRTPSSKRRLLEDLTREFVVCFNEACKACLKDARKNIQLTHKSFVK